MRHPGTAWRLPALAAAFLAFAPAWHRPPPEVDLALVLAVDISLSMDPDEESLQRQGYVEAFRSDQLHRAIREGMVGRIAVVYVEWAGAQPRTQRVAVPWTLLETPQDAIAFAERLARIPMHHAEGTSIAQAIDFSTALLRSGDFLALRRAIDISGDGVNNQGRLVTAARDAAIAAGITINGLPIVIEPPDKPEDAPLDAYYRDCVVGGAGAFMLPIHRPQQFLTETRAKILREIAGDDASVRPAAMLAQTDCDTSESLWNDPAPEP